MHLAHNSYFAKGERVESLHLSERFHEDFCVWTRCGEALKLGLYRIDDGARVVNGIRPLFDGTTEFLLLRASAQYAYPKANENSNLPIMIEKMS